ncbi:MAG: ABC transporter permease subunit, partial [Gemmatimonadales bacterium]|nr:ABC transporter permease subunit [Gemmatimonadales bacterium]
MIGRILTVAKREFAGYFDHATAYILLVIFLGINFYFYFQEAYLLGEASLRPMLSLLPWLLLFFIPAVCMRSFAEERNAGTLELVLAQPIQVVEFLLGKFLGVLFFLLIAMAGTLGIPLGLTFGADLQWGVVFSQYLGSMFLISALIAVGLWASSLTRNQVTAFIIGVTVSFALYLIGLPTVTLSLP